MKKFWLCFLAVSCAAAAQTPVVGSGTPIIGGNSGAGGNAPSSITFFGNGADGALNLTSGTSSLSGGEYWYTTCNIAAGATFTNFTNNLPIVIRCTGTATIAGTVTVLQGNTAAQAAYGGGTGGGGGGGTAAGAAGGGMSFASRGIGTGGTAGTSSGGTGGNGNTLALNYARLALLALTWGTGGATMMGGTGGGQGGSTGGAAGLGGGMVVIVAPTIIFTGTINANGTAGTAAPGNSTGGGGGGGGGLVLLAARNLTNTGTINVTGGAGGGCAAFTGCAAGGAGAAGSSFACASVR